MTSAAELGWPDSLSINAWTGLDVPVSPPGGNAAAWAMAGCAEQVDRVRAAPPPADLRDWRHPLVGWGLVLPDNDNLTEAERALAEDAPVAVQELLLARSESPVLRYRPELPQKLRRYYVDRPRQDIAIGGGLRGIGVGALPQYLLLIGSPAEIPWRLQYQLNHTAYTGRLDLDEVGLSNYIRALINEWEGAAARTDSPLVWSADHGRPDITWLMRGAIARPVAELYKTDTDLASLFLELGGQSASVAALTDALVSRRPGLIVTTSHGMTGPLDDFEQMRRHLGLLIDSYRDVLQPEVLLQRWQPDGAIWFAHACCSAGSDAGSRYSELLDDYSSVATVLDAVGSLGGQVAPLPRAMLSAQKPARAFIGQVEPTFDWTIRQPQTGQVITATLQQALYNRLYQRQPETVGMAFHDCHNLAGTLLAQWEAARRDAGMQIAGAVERAMRCQLAALDWQSLVILGDPTVSLRPLT